MNPAIIRTYQELRDALRMRQRELGLAHTDVDELGGLQGGYFGKIMCGGKCLGDVSLPGVLGALGLVIVVRPADAEGTRYDYLMPGAYEQSLAAMKKKHRENAALGGRKSMLFAKSAGKLSERQRHAVNSRWRAIRRQKREAEAALADKANATVRRQIPRDVLKCE